MGKDAASGKTENFHQSLNPTAFNRSQLNGKRSCKLKNKKKPSKPEPDGPKPNSIKREKKVLVEKPKKNGKASTPRPLTKGNKMGKEAASRKIKMINQSLNPTALKQRQ